MLSLKRLSFVSVFAVLLFAVLTGVAQTTFSGKVIDIESKEPLSFASVWVKSTNNAVITQIDGSFSIGPVRSSDTVLISALGYKDLEVYGNRISAAETEIEMIPAAIQIDAITVRPGKNPAIPIVKKAIHNRRDNRPENVKNIELISYNKLNFSLSGIDSTIFDLGFFRKHADVLVKTNDYDNTYNVPMYFSEYMNYEKRQENKLPEIQEIVKTQHGVSFAENEVVTKYMASLNEKMSFYNNIRFLSKDFISPISTQAMLYYRYYLDDSIVDNSRTYYRIRFRPKNSQDLAFYGYMIIEKDSGALAEIDATLQPTSILNFVRKLRLFEKYQLTADGQWFNRQQKMTAEFVPELSKDTAYKAINTPLTAIKSTTFIIDSAQINDYLQNRVVPGRFNLRRSDYGQRDTSFLSQYRPDTLTSLDLITQQAIEKTNQIPAVKAGNKVMNMLLYG
ncbi:MAG: carboxypeptidase-like regulatory domain-containing protein, partial [Bacteroidales bacterium]|nr:carboxypeptidase-like regulatory domain-containing protein [Bacteroidales bacterium]